MLSWLKGIAPILGVLAAGACLLGLGFAGQRLVAGSTEKEDTARIRPTIPLSKAAVPTIDAAATVRTETATFALG